MTHPQAPARPDEPRAPEIPPEVMKAARAAYDVEAAKPIFDVLDCIARAIMAATAAQQERDAQIVKASADSARQSALTLNEDRDGPDTEMMLHAMLLDQLADAIRAGS